MPVSQGLGPDPTRGRRGGGGFGRAVPAFGGGGSGSIPVFNNGPAQGMTQAPQGGGSGTTNTADPSPYAAEHMQRYRDRFSVDNTKRAIDRSNLGIADAAALGAADAKANMSRRGVVGSETGDAFLQKRVFQPAQRAAAGAAADIAMQRERDLDNLVLGGTGIMRMQDDITLANRGLNLDQLRADREDARHRAEIEREERRRREDAARWASMLDSF